MALMRGERPLIDALKPVQGSVRLAGLRLLLVTLSALPPLIAALGSLSSGPARQPYFTEIGGKLALIPFGHLMGSVFPLFAAVTLVCAAIAVLGDQYLTSGALTLLDPGRRVEGRVKVFGTVRREGRVHFWPFLRLLLVALVLSGAGILALRLIFKALGRAGKTAGWTGATLSVTLPFAFICLVMLWLATVGAWFFWCRVLTVADGRRRGRRTGLLALRVFWRHPFRSWAFFVAATLGSTIASGAVVAAWLQAEPRGGLAVLGWVLAWLLTLVAQVFVWHWLLRSGCLLRACGSLADLRSRTDEPFGVRSWISRRLRRKRALPAAELAQPAVETPLEGSSTGASLADDLSAARPEGGARDTLSARPEGGARDTLSARPEGGARDTLSARPDGGALDASSEAPADEAS